MASNRKKTKRMITDRTRARQDAVVAAEEVPKAAVVVTRVVAAVEAVPRAVAADTLAVAAVHVVVRKAVAAARKAAVVDGQVVDPLETKRMKAESLVTRLFLCHRAKIDLWTDIGSSSRGIGEAYEGRKQGKRRGVLAEEEN